MPIRACSPCIPCRYQYAVMACLGLVGISVMRLNTNMAIVAMVNHTALEKEIMNITLICPGQDIAPEEDGPFVWQEDQQALVLAAYFMGYMATQFLGAILSHLVRAKWVMFWSVAVNLTCSIAVPESSRRFGYVAFVVIRVIQGLFAGMTLPCMVVMTSRWAPPNERSILSAIVYAGFSMGVVLTYLLTGMLAKYLGWPWVFYLLAVLFIPWCIVWAIFVADNPEKCKTISEEERAYILNEQGQNLDSNLGKMMFPCHDVVQSVPYWALLFGIFCNDTVWYMTQTYTPKFMKDVLHRNLEENAVWSTVPFILNMLVSFVMGSLMDLCLTNRVLTTTTARQVTTAIGSLVPAFSLGALGFIECNYTAGISLMSLCVAALGMGWVGLLPNHIDLSPNFGGHLIAISTTVSSIPGIMMPLVIGELTKKQNTLAQWSIAFDIVACLLLIMCIVYTMYGSGEIQPWNTPKPKAPIPASSQELGLQHF